MLKTKKRLRRLGCGALLVLWFIGLTVPCFAVILAFQHEIIFTRSDLPEDNYRIWAIQEAHLRGVGLSISRRVDVQTPQKASCTVIDTRFLLWEGSTNNAHSCSCYDKQGENWTSIAEGANACKLAGE